MHVLTLPELNRNVVILSISFVFCFVFFLLRVTVRAVDVLCLAIWYFSRRPKISFNYSLNFRKLCIGMRLSA